VWSLPAPLTNGVIDQLNTALTYANGTPVYQLTAPERQAILAVYAAYDQLAGQPNPQLLPVALAGCADHLEGAYNQVQKNARLATMREGLLSATDVCPYCGYGDPTDLDHYLPKNVYKALAIYPRNLVPSCGPCNNAKRAYVPAAGTGFLHTYLEALPQVPFLSAQVQYAAGSLRVTFAIDPANIGQPLADRLTFHLDRLSLNDRYIRQINKFLSEQRPGLKHLLGVPGSPALLANYFNEAANDFDGLFGLNDWRAALFRGLSGSAPFLHSAKQYFG
jgi:hypothetical protein